MSGRFIVLSRLVAAGIAWFAVGCSSSHPKNPEPIVVDTTGLAARGEYIVRNVSVCGHCHAQDPEKSPDGPLSGGLAFRN